jgi:hypothetical protein
MAGTLILLENVDVKDLPPLAQELVALIGFSATIRLVENSPGIPQYIPQNISDEHYLVGMLGMAAASALVKNYGGDTITVPNCKRALCKIRHRQIRQSRSEGYSQNEAALLYGITPRQIRNIDSAEPKPETNLRLF